MRSSADSYRITLHNCSTVSAHLPADPSAISIAICHAVPISRGQRFEREFWRAVPLVWGPKILLLLWVILLNSSNAVKMLLKVDETSWCPWRIIQPQITISGAVLIQVDELRPFEKERRNQPSRWTGIVGRLDSIPFNNITSKFYTADKWHFSTHKII
jgi:hypothetical protein